MENIKLSINEIEILKHAIGFEMGNVKRGKLKSYRNRFCTIENDKEMKNLVKHELAVCGRQDEGLYFYYVTEKGFDYLRRLMEVKIEKIN